MIKKLVEKCLDFKRKASENKNPPKKSVNVGMDKNTISVFANSGVIQNASVTPIAYENNKLSPVTQICFPKTDEDISLFPEVEEISVIGNVNTQISFEISGRKYVLNYLIKKDDPEKKWLIVSKCPNNDGVSEYDVEWNVAHPFFKPYFENQDVFDVMKKFVFALVLSEIDSTYTSSDTKIEPCDIREKMNETLKTVIRN